MKKLKVLLIDFHLLNFLSLQDRISRINAHVHAHKTSIHPREPI